MNEIQLLKAIANLRSFFERKGIAKFDFPHDKLLDYPSCGLEHCHAMLENGGLYH
jgi:hypothetical protein